MIMYMLACIIMQSLSQSQLVTRHSKRAHSQHNLRTIAVSASAYKKYKPVSSNRRLECQSPETVIQGHSFTQSQKANLSSSLNLQHRQRIVRAGTLKRNETQRVMSARKGTSPSQIKQIHQFLRGSQSPRQKQIQEDNNRELIQKLLKIRCKLVNLPKNMIQSQPNSSRNQIIVQPEQLKTEQPSQSKICDLLMKKLSPTLPRYDKLNGQFRQLLEKKQILDEQASKPYCNQDIYNNIRKTYQNQNSPKKVSPSLNNRNKEKHADTKRQSIFQKISFSFRPKTKNLKFKEEELKGW